MLSRPLDSLYFAHTVLEIFLGLIKFVRGRYQHEAVGSRTGRSAMYVRHHGSSILAFNAGFVNVVCGVGSLGYSTPRNPGCS